MLYVCWYVSASKLVSKYPTTTPRMMNRPSRRRFVAFDDGSDVPAMLSEEEEMYKAFPNTSLAFSKEAPAKTGTLFLTTRRVIWSGADEAHDFDAAYIVLHAITHDVESYPQPCLYVQFDVDEDAVGGGLDEEDESEEGEDTEAFIVPASEEQLKELFDAFSHVAMLNPDFGEEDDDGESELIYNLDEVELGAEQARRLAQFEAAFLAGEPSALAHEGGHFTAAGADDEGTGGERVFDDDDMDRTHEAGGDHEVRPGDPV